MKPCQVSVLFVFLLIVAITRADNQKPSVPLPHISKQTRIDLVRAFNAELVYIRSPFPMGRKGLTLKDGKLSPGAEELQQMIVWLKEDLLPRSKGSYAIGADNFARQLRYEELVDIPLDRLLAIGEANLRRDQEAFVATANKIDPAKNPTDVLLALTSDHPTEDDLVPSVR